MGWGGPPAPKNTGMEHGTVGVDMGTGREGAWQENVGRREMTARNKEISRETAKTPGGVWEELGSACSGEPPHPPGLGLSCFSGQRGPSPFLPAENTKAQESSREDEPREILGNSCTVPTAPGELGWWELLIPHCLSTGISCGQDGGQPVVASEGTALGVLHSSSSWIWCFENGQNCFSFSTNSVSAAPSPSTSCCRSAGIGTGWGWSHQAAPGLGCLPSASEQMTFPWAPEELEHIGNSGFKMFSSCEQLTLLYWEMMHQAPGTAPGSDFMEGHHSWSCASA